MRVRIVEGPGRDNGQGARVDSLFRNLVKPSEMPRPLALTGITAHTHKHFTSSDKTQKRIYIYIYMAPLTFRIHHPH